METVVYLIRHSEAISKNNINNINNNDSSQISNEKACLSVSGEVKAMELSKTAELQNIDAVYSSTYVRALATAKYIACENNTIINVDERLNERKIGLLGDMDIMDFHRLQSKNFDFKLSSGESVNQTKKRMADALKSILVSEAGNRLAVISHSTAITALLSSWCELGYNFDDNIILNYNDKSILAGHFTAPMVFKITFDGMNVIDIDTIE